MLLAIGRDAPDVQGIRSLRIDAPDPALAARYLGEAAQALYLVRPDQHVAARWDNAEPGQIIAARDRALGKGKS